MDSLSLLGVIVAILAILGGQYLEGGSLLSLINAPAFLIVFGGTLGAIFISTPKKIFFRALQMLPWMLFPPKYNSKKIIKKIVGWAEIARKQGYLGIEEKISHERDPFIIKIMQLLIDGNEPEVIRYVMDIDIAVKENFDIRATRVYEGMGGYSPTLGILGAVMGLITVMSNLSNPEVLGAGIAVAFVATIYGVAFANLIYLPIAHKLRELVRNESDFKEMIVEGVIDIAKGDNPKNIEIKLEMFK